MQIQELVQIQEASRGRATVTVIRPGFNSDKSKYYDRAALRRDHKVFEGVKMFCDHPTRTGQRERPERSVRDVVGVLENVRVAGDGSIKGQAAITAPWFKKILEGFKAQGLLRELGVSIVAGGRGVKKTIQGIKTLFIEAIIQAGSVDFVTYPGAGGVVEMYESADWCADPNERARRRLRDTMTEKYRSDGLSEPERRAALYVDPDVERKAAIDARIAARKAAVPSTSLSRSARAYLDRQRKLRGE